MHPGNIETQTAAARVYQYLRNRTGEWVGGWELTIACETTAVSTRISEVRYQLAVREGEAIESKCVDGKWFYRVVTTGQMALGL